MSRRGDIMQYITTKEAAAKWAISDRRVRVLCSEGKIAGAMQIGRAWMIPEMAEKPMDERRRRHKKPVSSKSEEYNFSIINKKKSQLENLRPLTMGEVDRLREEFLVEFTYNSNAIEGNTLTLQETAMVIKEGITIDQKPLKDHLEVIGHKDAYEYVLRLVQNKEKLSERIIKELHTLILIDKPQDRGVYRNLPVRIMGAVHEPPQPYLVPVQMEQLLNDYEEMNNTLHPVQRIALFHLLFEGVHPFIDGNGRTGRLLLNLELMKEGYPPINVKFADRRRYYECFNSYYTSGNPGEMIHMVSEYVEQILDRYIQILSE